MCLPHPPASLSEARSCVSALEEELRAKAGALKSVQSEVVQSKKELAAREISLQKARDELSLAHARMAQESERVKTHTVTAHTPGTTTDNKCFIPVLMFYISIKSCCLCHRMGVGFICQNISLCLP